MALPHGGNIYHYSRKYGIPKEKFLDFSASINPLGPPRAALKALKGGAPQLVNYPDPDSGLLLRALSERLEIGRGSLLVGNGSTELIYLLPRVLRPKKALVFAPTFSDYERAARLSGARVSYLHLQEKNGFAPDMEAIRKSLGGVDMLFLCNPNNPTGVLMEQDVVLDVLKMARKAGVFTVVDEAFIEFAPGRSVVKEASGRRDAAVLRNFTKFYGMPGLRAGYLAARPSLVGKLNAAKEPWSVNTLAELAASASLTDDAYEKQTLRLIEQEKEYLYRELAGMPGLRPYPPSVNFMLIKLEADCPTAHELVEMMASKGILVRDCSNFRGLDGSFIRVAVRTRPENNALLCALKESLSFTPH